MLKHVIQNNRRWIKTSADSCIKAAAKSAKIGGKCSAHARIATKEIEEDALLSPTEKSKASASEIIPSDINVSRPTMLPVDIKKTESHWPTATMPMDTIVTRATYTYDRKFIRSIVAPAWQLAGYRNPTGRNLAHQLTDEIEQRRHNCASPPLGVASTRGTLESWSQRSAMYYSADAPLCRTGAPFSAVGDFGVR